ncbi:hypothetical protein [Piscibacillus salipiscarius]|uniref:hypothetical protein n=1 Tax=Piscibacillus salipiscarius TaxID=299480 RepID=UPI000B0F0DCB
MKPLSNSHKQLKGTLEVPGDKSISHRAIMLGALAQGETKVYNFLHSEDSMSTILAFQRLGVDIDKITTQ